MSRVLGHCPGGYLSRRVSVLGSLSSRISGQVGVSLQWGLSMGSLGNLCPGVLCPVRCLWGLSEGLCMGLCPGDIYTGGSLSMGSVHGVSVQEGPCLGGLCPGKGLSMGSLSRRVPVKGSMSRGGGHCA